MAKRSAKKGQLELVVPRWGGKPKGAGRKRRAGRAPRVDHRRRDVRAGRFPVLVTLRIRPEWRSLRVKDLLRLLHGVVRATCDRGLVRIKQFSFMRDHVHLIVEADDGVAVSRGMQGFGVRLAKALHAHHGKGGSVTADRYHARDL